MFLQLANIANSGGSKTSWKFILKVFNFMDSSCFVYMQTLRFKFVFCCVYIQTLQYISSYAPTLDYCIQLFTFDIFFFVHVVLLNMFCILHQEIREKSSVHFFWSLIDFLETKYMFTRNWYFFLETNCFFVEKIENLGK